jgi:hypothetical protein
MYPAKLDPVSQDLHVIPHFLVTRLKILVRNRTNRDVKRGNLSGLEQYQLSSDHHQDRRNGEVVRWISQFYKRAERNVQTIRPTWHPQEHTFLTSRNHPTQDPDSIRVGNDTAEGNTSSEM